MLDSRCRQLQWRQIRVELLAQLHFRERYLVASLNHISQTASRLRDQVDKSVTEVMNLSRDNPMPIYLEVASQDSHGADVATLARMFMPGGMGGGSDDASGKASASSRLWLRLHVLSLQRRKVARGRVRLWSAFDQFWWSVTLPQSAHWKIRLEAQKIYRSLSNSQSDGRKYSPHGAQSESHPRAKKGKPSCYYGNAPRSYASGFPTSTGRKMKKESCFEAVS